MSRIWLLNSLFSILQEDTEMYIWGGTGAGVAFSLFFSILYKFLKRKSNRQMLIEEIKHRDQISQKNTDRLFDLLEKHIDKEQSIPSVKVIKEEVPIAIKPTKVVKKLPKSKKTPKLLPNSDLK